MRTSDSEDERAPGHPAPTLLDLINERFTERVLHAERAFDLLDAFYITGHGTGRPTGILNFKGGWNGGS